MLEACFIDQVHLYSATYLRYSAKTMNLKKNCSMPDGEDMTRAAQTVVVDEALESHNISQSLTNTRAHR